MREGSPCRVITDARGEDLARLRLLLSGFEGVESGDPALVPLINSIGSREGIRAAVRCRKRLREYNIPKSWEDIVIRTVCAGTMRAYVADDLGGFARKLAEETEREEGLAPREE